MNVIKACWVKAKPIAVPTNGAVQGVASSVTKNPRLDDLWYPFDQEKIAALIKQNKVVFIDVTAEWCLTCKTNELLTLKQKQVKERLSKPDVVAMKADWTNSIIRLMITIFTPRSKMIA